MKGFLKKKTLAEVHLLLEETIEKITGREGGVETIHTSQALSRITAAPVRAHYAVPICPTAAMDGIALVAEETFGATKNNPCKIQAAGLLLVNTGNAVAKEYNAVIKIEDIEEQEDGYLIFHPALPGQHIRPPGEDIQAGEVILPSGHPIGAEDMGALLACGLTRVQVRKRPSLAIIPTGSELIPPGKQPAPGEVVEFNSQVVAALVKGWGGEGVVVEGMEDDPDLLKAGLLELADQYQILVTLAGSSAGTRDYLPDVVEEVGELLLHGVSIRPGKPFFLGTIGSTLVLGLPGYPVSCYLDAHLFLQRAIYLYSGLPLPSPETVMAISGQDILSSTGVDEFVRVSLGEVNRRLVAQPLSRGASMISSLVQGDGFLPIPRLQGGVLAGEQIQVELFPTRDPVERFFVTGSHHPLLDTLREYLLLQGVGIDLVSGGKQQGAAGLYALKEGRSHLASLYLPLEALSTPLLSHLDEKEAYFLHLTRGKGAGNWESPFSKLGDPICFGLLFLPHGRGQLECLLQLVQRKDFSAKVEKSGYCSKYTGVLQQVKGE